MLRTAFDQTKITETAGLKLFSNFHLCENRFRKTANTDRYGSKKRKNTGCRLFD